MIFKSDVWVIIPARGGSKGVPKKNIRSVGGKPLIAHSILAAKEAQSVNKVFVSTDNDEISEVSKKYGAEIVLRPTDISGDTASSESALLHALESLGKSQGYLPECFVFMQCTSPFTVSADIDGAVEKVTSKGADSVFTGTKFYHFVWKEGPMGAEGINHDKFIRLRRQDIEPQYQETGAIYAFKTRQFLKAKHRFFGNIQIQEVPFERSLDIDTELDIKFAELLMSKSSG